MRNDTFTGYSTVTKVPEYKKLNNDIRSVIKNPLKENIKPEILFITTFPPRECGIATYAQDLIKALNSKFNHSFNITVCPMGSDNEQHIYTEASKYSLDTDHPKTFDILADSINKNDDIKLVLIQHEFGLFEKREKELDTFLNSLTKPKVLVFHTVLPQPDHILKLKVRKLAKEVESLVVMTNNSAKILIEEYGIISDKITVIEHGTHLVTHADKKYLKKKHNLTGRKILSTFGLLGSGKSIETTLDALPEVIADFPEVIFLIIGKTHPSVVKREGEKYRSMLEDKVKSLHLEQHVRFINSFVPLPELLEYLQLTYIYLFTSKDPNQAVSGTFSYAISCGCPIISTPIPHAREVLKDNAGIIFDFENSRQLSKNIIRLLKNDRLRKNIGYNGLHRMAATAWENSAISHALLFEKMSRNQISLKYTLPPINLAHFQKMTKSFGMIQFSKINHPDIDSGFTLDDNARAMVAMCQHYELTKDKKDLKWIQIYFDLIKYCLQPDGKFLNYVNENHDFTNQNYETNLEDSNGRAIWALGYLISFKEKLPEELSNDAATILNKALTNVRSIHSTRAMAFIIKGLYYVNQKNPSASQEALIKEFANRLVQMYRHEASTDWQWFESYLTYGNSILPEAMLCAWLITRDDVYKDIAKTTFDFLLSKIFHNHKLMVISNKTWLQKTALSSVRENGGEQPIDVAYTILALEKFYEVFQEEMYLKKMHIAFNWFLGSNHLHQIIYNPCTGGCYDGLEETNVNLNQGAESTVSYLMARLTMEKYGGTLK
ncbi:MAG: glycosyltransferase [Saprospiraceae bacterium]|nr:glycosyltransferase [Saprospiraceae bacterium]